jgi:hypothetical protein
MAEVQATLLMDGGVFFWAPDGDLDDAVSRELPLVRRVGRKVRQPLIEESDPHKRSRVLGYALDHVEAIRLLTRVAHDADLSDSIRVWARAAQLGLELAAQKRVVPTVEGGNAQWRVLLTRSADRARFDRLVRALPVNARAVPTRERGPVRLPTAHFAMKSFLDRTVDTVYRQAAWPGSARGWALEFAEALRGADPSFAPRDARYQGIPERIAAWSGETEATGLRLGIELHLPHGDAPEFPVHFVVYGADDPDNRRPVADAWSAGGSMGLGRSRYVHPAWSALRGLARAARVFPPLAAAFRGRIPRDLVWDAQQTWSFLSDGVDALRDAGFDVDLPEEFDVAGRQRLTARMRIAMDGDVGAIGLAEALSFRWEVALGDHVVDGADFAELTAKRQPIVRFRGQWVLLDPNELARLPDGLLREGRLDAAVALRAVLSGEHEGVPVVADERLAVVLDALREPPPVEIPAGLRATLRPYQVRGFAWLQALGQLGLGACLADDMGLGKTVQFITHVLARRPNARGPALVVCPTSVLGNWSHEIARFAPSLVVRRYHGLDRDPGVLKHADVVITTYGLLVRDVDLLEQLHWDVVALDEGQAIKNPDSQRARCARRLVADHRVAMSGTPVENRLLELWSLLDWLVPGLLGTRARFRRQVAIPIERFGDEAVAQRLQRGVAPFLLRRLKTDPTVISDLPEKIERRAWCSLTAEQAAMYEDVVETCMERIRSSIDQERRGHVLAMLTALKQVCNHPAHYRSDASPLARRSGKLEHCVELLDTILENGERALIFTQYREMGTLLQGHLSEVFGEEVPFLHGGTPATAREEMVRAFQEDDDAPPVLIISLRAGGTGLNLTRATHVLHYDRWWNPAVEDQATDRVYRIGQRENVLVHKLVTSGTLEERIDAMLEDKRALAEAVVASGDRWVTELDDDALRQLVALGDDARMEDADA